MTIEKIKQQEAFAKLSRYCASLNNPRRISLLLEVASQANCVKDEFVEVDGLNKFAVNMNLKYLKKYGLVNGTFTSKQLQYCINYEKLEEFKSLFDDFYNNMIENKECVGLTTANCSKI